MKLFFPPRHTRSIAIAVLLCCIAACSTTKSDHVYENRRYVEMLSGNAITLNYTPWYIHESEIEGPDDIRDRDSGQTMGGGGSNVMPAGDEWGIPSGGGKWACCTSYPRHWIPDLRVTVRWLVNEKMDGHLCWYKAENVRGANSGGGVLIVFLPGDRVRLTLPGNPDANTYKDYPKNDPYVQQPDDDDPYIAQGVPDDERNGLSPDGHMNAKLFGFYYTGGEEHQRAEEALAREGIYDEANMLRCNPNYKSQRQQ